MFYLCTYCVFTLWGSSSSVYVSDSVSIASKYFPLSLTNLPVISVIIPSLALSNRSQECLKNNTQGLQVSE